MGKQKQLFQGAFVRCPDHESRLLIILLANRVGRLPEDSATWRDRNNPADARTWPVLKIFQNDGNFTGHMEDGSHEFTVDEMIQALTMEDSIHNFRLTKGLVAEFAPGEDVIIGDKTVPADRVKRFIHLYNNGSYR